jgi:putative transposase
MLGMVDDWGGYLALDVNEAEMTALRRHERTGRPLGGAGFIARLEKGLGRFLRKHKPGPKGPRAPN